MTYNEFLKENIIEKIRIKFKKRAKIILNNHSLSNVNDINEILFNVKSMLAKKGIYSIQTFYTLDVYKKKLIENFNHEHLNYFTVSTIDKLANRHGLEVVKAFHITAKGGSIRTYISHIGDYKVDIKVTQFKKKENDFLKSSYNNKMEKFI